MAHDGDGKGPGYIILWGLVAALFGGLVTWAWIVGAVPWWAGAVVDVGLAAGLAALMLTAKWA